MVRKDTEGRVRLKIVFYGASMSGKTTQLRSLYDQAQSIEKGKITSLEDPTGRTLFFDFVPMAATGKVVFDVYTTAGSLKLLKTTQINNIADNDQEGIEAW